MRIRDLLQCDVINTSPQGVYLAHGSNQNRLQLAAVDCSIPQEISAELADAGFECIDVTHCPPDHLHDSDVRFFVYARKQLTFPDADHQVYGKHHG